MNGDRAPLTHCHVEGHGTWCGVADMKTWDKRSRARWRRRCESLDIRADAAADAPCGIDELLEMRLTPQRHEEVQMLAVAVQAPQLDWDFQ